MIYLAYALALMCAWSLLRVQIGVAGWLSWGAA